MKHWPYTAYAFDLYGTLADIRTDEEDPALWRAMSFYLGLRGMPWEPEALREQYGLLGAQSLAEKEAALQARGIPGPGEADIRDVWRRIGLLRGIRLEEEQVERIACAFRAMSLKKLRLFDGAREVLAALRRGRRRVFLLTNAQAAFTGPELRYLGIDGAFDGIFMSSDYGVKKPSPAFFDLLFRAGAEPARTVMIGNDDQCDCWGAARAGLHSLYLSTEQSPPLLRSLPSNCRKIDALMQVLPACDR